MARISYVDPGTVTDPEPAAACTMGQQRFLKTLQVKHGDLDAVSLAGLAPEVARELGERKV